MLKAAHLPFAEPPVAPPARVRTRVGDVPRPPNLLPRYYAFLSYSHKDSELAQWLHRELEQFRVPPSLVGRVTANGAIPKRLTPIFRDEHELAAADNLGAEIKAAIASSQYLVVLCSHSAARSRWVNAEVDRFKRTRPDGCVLAAIAAGEPFASERPGQETEECFPAALRQRYDRRGRPTPKRAEPLAADLRHGSGGKLLGVLKLVAGMLGVGLDELVQREHVRRQKRLALLAAASLAGMTVTSGLALWAVQARDEARDQRREAEGLVGFMLGDLKEKLEPIGRLDALDAVGSRALAYYQRQDKGGLSDESLAQRARALTLMGEIANTRGDLNGALKRYNEALASTAEAVRRYPDDPKRLFDHAQNIYWIGYIAYQRGHPAEAAARFRYYRRLADRMAALVPDNKDYRLEQVYANTNLGTVLMEERRYREAAAIYQATLSAAESLAAAEPRNIDYQTQLSEALAWLADARENAGDLDGALATRERQLAVIGQRQALDPRNMEVPRDEMTARRSIGRLLLMRGDLASALRESRAAVAISDTLFRTEPDNTEWLQANASGRFDLADIQLASGQRAAAAATVRSGCDIVDRLIQRDQSVADWKAVQRTTCVNHRARLALAEGDGAQAFSFARNGLVAAQASPNAGDRAVLSFLLLSTGGKAMEMMGRQAEAAKWFAAGQNRVRSGIQLRPTELAELAIVQTRLGGARAAAHATRRLQAMGYRHPAFVAAVQTKERGQ